MTDDGARTDLSSSDLLLAEAALTRLAACLASMSSDEMVALTKVSAHLEAEGADVEGFGARFHRPRLGTLDVEIKTVMGQIQQLQSAEMGLQGANGTQSSIAASLNRTAQSLGDLNSALRWP